MTRPVDPALLLALALTACARTPPATTAPRKSTVYDVVVMVASAERQVESVYTLAADPIGPGVWVFTTLSSAGAWSEEGTVLNFDSAQPKRSDPWPVTLQHAISAVPATYQMDERGAPVAILSAEIWKKAAVDVVYGLDLPVQALGAGEALLDPEGMVEDLRRNFPGAPSSATWERSERIAGFKATRRAQCAQRSDAGVLTWTCEGEVIGPAEGPARLTDVSSTTWIAIDRWGLRRLETTYSGTLVMLGPGGHGVLDRPIAGKRLVQRR